MEEYVKVKPVSRHPSVKYNVTFVIPNSFSYSDVSDIIKSHAGSLLESAKLTHVYRSENSPSYNEFTFALEFRDLNRTLSTSEVVCSLHNAIKVLNDLGVVVK